MSILHTVLQSPGDGYDFDYQKVSLLLQNVQNSGGPVVTDLSMNGVTGVKNGTVNYVSGGRFGWGGFGFPNSPISVNNVTFSANAALDLLADSAWSVELRHTPTQVAGTWYTLFALEGTTNDWHAATGGHLRVYINNTGAVNVQVKTSGGNASFTHPTTLTINTHYYLRVAYAAGTLVIEVNGVVSTHTVTPARPTNAPTARLGATFAAADSYRGTVWALRLTKGVARAQKAANASLPFGVHPFVVPPVVGQQVITVGVPDATWTVPVGVSSINIVCIGLRAILGGTTIVQAQAGAIVGDGGFAGGAGGATYAWEETVPDPGAGFGGGTITITHRRYGGGGGAGGYGAAGGQGGTYNNQPPRGSGASGSGAGGFAQGEGTPATNGGGASLLGLVPGGGALYGPGIAGVDSGGSPLHAQAGQPLAWRNAIAVSAGQVITFQRTNLLNTTAAARILYGGDRSFPDNAGDL